MQLVTTDGKMVLTDSQMIARSLGMKNAYVMRVVDEFLDDYPDLRVTSNHPSSPEYIRIVEREYRGQKFRAAEMNRECFSLLFMRFDTPLARMKQREFNKAFYDMEARLVQYERNQKDSGWIASREAGKIGRKEEADVIAEFVEYATGQGSKNARHYFSLVTNATYRALELLANKKPKLRDTLDGYELAELLLAERYAAFKLREYMGKKREYHDIYDSVVDDLVAYCGHIKMPRALAHSAN